MVSLEAEQGEDAPYVAQRYWLDKRETAARIRAAVAYYGPEADQEVADAVGISKRSLQRWKTDGFPRSDLSAMERLADACGLPADFFTADLGRLAEIVPSGEPKLGGAWRPASQLERPTPRTVRRGGIDRAIRAAEAEAQQRREGQRPAPPSDRRAGGQRGRS
jgi:transcriptional regulator with XRE-family HTH domain